MPNSLVGINTLTPNRLIFAACSARSIPELAEYDSVQREVRTSANTRLDLRLDSPRGKACFVEIKNCTLVEDGAAYFPDAVTSRGLKHLMELERLAATGHRAIVFFLIQRMDAEIFRPADTIDPAYCNRLRKAVQNNVEILAYDVQISLTKISLGKRLPCDISHAFT